MYAVSLDSSLARRVQGNLDRSSERINGAVRQLSSGLRISSAKDDAAGAAIAEKMTSRVRGFDQARRNANDAVSALQTAEGGLNTVANHLQRIRELAVQAVNDTQSASDRAALQQEAGQLVAGIDSLAQQTEFNGKRLLDGSFVGVSFQTTGDAHGQMSEVGLRSLRTADLKKEALTSSGSGAQVAGTVDLSNNFYSLIAASSTSAPLASTNITNLEFSHNGGPFIAIPSLTVNTNPVANANEFALQVDLANFAAGGAHNAFVIPTDTLQLRVGGTFSDLASAQNEASRLETLLGLPAGYLGTPAYNASSTLTSNGSVSQIDLSTSAGATTALKIADDALAIVSNVRNQLGAEQNRIGHQVANLQTASENTAAARSRIRDADYGVAVAGLTSGQIAQQAGIAMLAQASSQPQQVLTLLRSWM